MAELYATAVLFFIVSLIIAWTNYRGMQNGRPLYRPAVIVAQFYLIFFLIGLVRYCLLR